MKNLLKLSCFLLALWAIPSMPAQADSHESANPWEGYEASGTEPYWSLRITRDSIVFDHMAVFSAQGGLVAPTTTRNGTVFLTTIHSAEGDPPIGNAAGRDFIVLIEDEPCTGEMTSMPFPQSVRVFVAGFQFVGCGGRIVDALAGGPWQIVSLDGAPLPSTTSPTIEFGEDSRVSGMTGCNRYFSQATITGESLTFGPIGMTRRMCTGDRGRFEPVFIARLGAVDRAAISENGDLRLYTADRLVIVARR
jgi:heat shock protein HslJ